MLKWMKSALEKPVKDDKEHINHTYRYWRIHIMLGMYAGYAVYYFTRKSFNYVMPEMLVNLNITVADVGLMGTLFYFMYGASRFISGILSDAANPRYFMGIGLILTGIINILFGLSSSLWVLMVFWICNAFFQGWGWAPCSKLLTSWYSRNERGFWWAVCNTSHNVGGAIIPLLAGYLAVQYGWRYGMIVPGIIAIVVGCFLCFRLRDRPVSMGLPTVGYWRDDQLEIEQEQKSAKLPIMEILKRYIFTNKYIWLLAISYVFVYIVRIGINDWGNLYLVKNHNYSLVKANSALTMLEIGGFIGTIVAGWGSDKLFSGNRVPMNIIFMAGIFFSVLFLWLLRIDSYFLNAACFFAIGFFIFGPQMLIGMAAAESAHKDSAGAATGFVGIFGYLGAGLSGWPLAKVLEIWHWNGFFTVLSITTVLSALLLLPLISKKKIPTFQKQQFIEEKQGI
ncbi:MFS transporter family glucose-6-phosphate receptor UhpC [Pragia fontium]|uniref:MFS transporter, OPA family, sugar phosphate sensor protein UhpC n=2 Tax=Pragia fontium TaxID=82985 RepID=A0AAJ5BIP8_9GAMM|nr:MFS transporter family glucose-6-phosphate receptor UhpC [Pragia fontium]AKJ43381.1 MFS transporter [Pragia fontium]GKX64725.1 regulatory protein UhpC [Pragia fontium]SFD45176.1 MFS transporter, OPA family, sugar phosphate sensor protein UhpC [Pragia fontium DSM 5563 = ATCC 49100]VEJ56757.1 Regulatory protein uhpC [Pragia fontium]